MNGLPRRFAGAAFAALVALAPGAGTAAPRLMPVAPEHGGSSTAVTSDYRVTVAEISPQVQGLHASVADVAGTLRLTWSGAGTLVIDGYDGEPYLQISAAGVERNVRSPATYLNQNRYARVKVPAIADSSAAPEWQRISGGRTVVWHDHRTHWMDTAPPAMVAADRSQTHVIYDAWKVPLQVDGKPVSIVGRLLWIPPPSGMPWLLAGVAAAAILLALLFTTWWRRALIAMSALGTVVFTVDGFGFLARNHRGILPWVWAFGWPVVAIAATVVVAVQVRRRRDQLPIAMIVAGLVVGVVGGIDRVDGVTNSQVFSALPDAAARVAAVTALAIGSAIVLRFLADLVPMLVTGKRRVVPGTAPPEPATGTS
jgi:hypothetical protein